MPVRRATDFSSMRLHYLVPEGKSIRTESLRRRTGERSGLGMTRMPAASKSRGKRAAACLSLASLDGGTSRDIRHDGIILVVFVFAAVAPADVFSEATNSIAADPFHHFVAELVFHAQPQRRPCRSESGS